MPISTIGTNSVASGITLTSPVTAGTPTGVGVLTSGTAQASTSGTSIDFTGIPSWVKRITVMFNGFSTNGSSNYLIQIGSGSVTSSGYTGATAYTGAATGASVFTAGFGIPAGGALNVTYGHVIITAMGSNAWVASICAGDNAGGTGYAWVGGGSVTLSGTLDRVRITTSNGTDTFDAGSINILYE